MQKGIDFCRKYGILSDKHFKNSEEVELNDMFDVDYLGFFSFDLIASINSMESMECMYEKVSCNVTFSGICRNAQIIVMW